MLKLPKLRAEFYRSVSGREPVREWIDALPPHDRKVIREDITEVQFEWPMGRPRVDHLRDGLWEIRSRLENRQARVLFAFTGREMVILHGFIKKTRATPSEELEVAERRWKVWQGQQKGDDRE